ncbi:AMP-binding protein [Streptomyces roseirectus]|uniref:AMP-binding protein n=1 Tax=Streptomyces roseirectus TaxID=2768066 RepID=A0A7H0INE3_9ACTN|nr:AMP-binding protein [Streptomyces roseirectus]QNP74309.1 AMP-binding protein [Streptomyces roseirectus]
MTLSILTPPEEQVADYLSTRVDTDTGQPVRRLGLADVREAFAAAGLTPGSPVLIAVTDAHTQLTAFLAAHYAGLVPVLLPRVCPEHRRRIVADALGAAALATTAPGFVVRRIATGHPRLYEPGQAIVMTSGNSGTASGCLHRVSALFDNARRHAEAIGLRGTDTVWLNLPMHYSFTLVAQALAGIVTGARLVLSGPPFDPAAYREGLLRHGVTVSSLSPSLVRSFLDDTYELPSSLRVLTVGGDALEATHVKELLARHRGGELYLTYGLTEAGPRVSTLAAHREPPERLTSVGLPLPGVEVAVRGEGAKGELLVTTPTAMVRRVGHGAAGRRGLVAADTVATGDVFRVDDSGHLFFCGRLSDFVVINGDRVSLRWVRELVGALPGVLHVRTEIVHADAGRGGVGRQRYRLHVTAREASQTIRDQVTRRLKEVLLRVEFPCDVVVRELQANEFAK